MKAITIRRTALLAALIIGVVFCLCIYSDCQTAFAQRGTVPMFFSEGYAGGTYLETQTEEIGYEYKTEEKQSLGLSFPDYFNTSSQLTNSCANVAGANVIGYFDRDYVNLIPDYTPGRARGDSYSYYPMSVELEKKQAVIDELYTLMGTNAIESGTSYDQYKAGFDAYVTAQGYTAVHSSVMSGGNLNLNAVSESITAGRPVILFLSGYNLASLSSKNGKDVYIKMIYGGNHMVVVYEINTLRYYNAADQLIAERTIMQVATGFNDVKGFYIVDNNGLVINAEAVGIN